MPLELPPNHPPSACSSSCEIHRRGLKGQVATRSHIRQIANGHGHGYSSQNEPTILSLRDDTAPHATIPPHQEQQQQQQQQPPRHKPLFKTRLCTHFQQKGLCENVMGCDFAHGLDELRSPSQPRTAIATATSSVTNRTRDNNHLCRVSSAQVSSARTHSVSAPSSSSILSSPLLKNFAALQKVLLFSFNRNQNNSPVDFIKFALVCKVWCDEVMLEPSISGAVFLKCFTEVKKAATTSDSPSSSSFSLEKTRNWLNLFDQHLATLSPTATPSFEREVPFHILKTAMKVLSGIPDGSKQLTDGVAVRQLILTHTVHHAARLDQPHFLHFLSNKTGWCSTELLFKQLNHLPESKRFQMSNDCVDAIGQNRLRFRTQLCGYTENVKCHHQTCAYAHSAAELRPIPEGAKRAPAKQTHQYERRPPRVPYDQDQEDYDIYLLSRQQRYF